jgi:hypothetical protein
MLLVVMLSVVAPKLVHALTAWVFNLIILSLLYYILIINTQRGKLERLSLAVRPAGVRGSVGLACQQI